MKHHGNYPLQTTNRRAFPLFIFNSVELAKEKIYLNTNGTNEATYVHALIRPTFVRLFAKDTDWIKFVWSESTLKCKKDEENELLLDYDGKATTASKIDGIILDELNDVEIGLIEVSGPNCKVNTSHFYEDRKKIAKNLQCMYRTIVNLKTNVSLLSRKDIKVYGFHFYRKSDTAALGCVKY